MANTVTMCCSCGSSYSTANGTMSSNSFSHWRRCRHSICATSATRFCGTNTSSCCASNRKRAERWQPPVKASIRSKVPSRRSSKFSAISRNWHQAKRNIPVYACCWRYPGWPIIYSIVTGIRARRVCSASARCSRWWRNTCRATRNPVQSQRPKMIDWCEWSRIELNYRGNFIDNLCISISSTQPTSHKRSPVWIMRKLLSGQSDRFARMQQPGDDILKTARRFGGLQWFRSIAIELVAKHSGRHIFGTIRTEDAERWCRTTGTTIAGNIVDWAHANNTNQGNNWRPYQSMRFKSIIYTLSICSQKPSHIQWCHSHGHAVRPT